MLNPERRFKMRTISRVGILILFILTYCQACTSYRAEKHYRQGIAYQEKGAIEKAEKEFMRTIHYDPSHVKARLALASIFESRKLWDTGN